MLLFWTRQKFCPEDEIFLKITFRLLVYLRKGFEVDASWYQIQLPRRPMKWQGPDSGHGTKIKIITTTKGNQQHVQNQQAIWNSFCILVLFAKIFLQNFFIPTPVRFLNARKKGKNIWNKFLLQAGHNYIKSIQCRLVMCVDFR